MEIDWKGFADFRSIRDLSIELGNVSNRCDDIWSSRRLADPEWKLPLHPQSPLAIPSNQGSVEHGNQGFATSPWTMPEAHTPTHSVGSGRYEDPVSLMARGKGKHTCYYGPNCDKGGVHGDGTLIVFERNSAFR